MNVVSPIYRCCCAITLLILAACLATAPPVIGPGESEEIYGASGAWVDIDSGDHHYLRANDDGSMNVNTDELKLVFRTARINENAFVMEAVGETKNGRKEGMMVLGHSVPDYLVIYGNVPIAKDKQAAEQTGLQLHLIKNDLSIVPGQPRLLVIETFAALEQLVTPGSGLILKRAGAFIERE